MNVQDILTQLIVIAELAFVLVFVFGLLDVATRDRSTQAAAPVTQAAVSPAPIVNVDSANSVEFEFAATPTIADPWTSEVTVVQPSSMPQLSVVRSNVLCLSAAQPLFCLPSARPAVSAPQPPKSQSKASQSKAKGKGKGKAPSQTEQLRCQCTAQGVKWRNANGTNKHLTTKQMQQALELKSIAA